MRAATEVWTFDPVLQPNRNWVGYKVHTTDGDIGKVDELTTEAGRGSIVVDTGPWIFGKKRMLPAACVHSINHDAKTITVSLTKDQVKQAPDYEELRQNQEDYRTAHGDYYGRIL
jgi:hypothetical protein